MLEVLPHQDSWSDDFRRLQDTLEQLFQGNALAISHIGSTAIVGLVAKPIIDIQVSVGELAVMSSIELLPDGFEHVVENNRDFAPLGYSSDASEWRKHFVHVIRGDKRHAHIHIREVGRANERIALLFRDFLREHSLHRAAYGQLKLQLANVVGHLATESGSGPYVELKDPLIAVILNAAEEWAHSSDWRIADSR